MSSTGLMAGVRPLNSSLEFRLDGDGSFRVLWKDDERVFCRGRLEVDGKWKPVLALLPASERPQALSVTREKLPRRANES